MTERLYEIFRLNGGKICTDTRKPEKGSLFFALKGDSFDGNQFARSALEAGCTAAVIDNLQYKADERFILVKDALTSLQQLASFHRDTLRIPVIGITGSNGKTTTKELTALVLSRKYRTYHTKGNLNNHIGVPLSVLSISDETEIAIIEMGANHRGEIARLCEIAKPDYGIITNIGKAHLEGFGSPEGVKVAKKELYDYIEKRGGRIFLNADNPVLMEISGDIEKIMYGGRKEYYCHAELLDASPFMQIKWKGSHIRTRVAGRYNFENALAAICVGMHFNVPDHQIVRALESYNPSNSRSQLIEKGSNRILLDAYNANPVSMKAALDNFDLMAHESKYVILGDMLELGDYSKNEHRQIVQQLDRMKLAGVLLIGKEFHESAHERFHVFPSTEKAKKELEKLCVRNSLILMKGSRGMKLETLLDVL